LDSEPFKAPAKRFIVALALGAALTPLNSTMIAVALPSMGESFQVSSSDLTLWLVSSYLLVNIILQSPAGKLGDIVGRRRAFMIGLSLFAIGALIATLAPYLPVVATSRVLMAAGGAMLVPNAMALLRNVIPEHRRSSAFGYFGALLSASAAVGPMLGGMLTEYFGWKAIFLVNLPLLLISWVLVKSDTSYVRPAADIDTARPRFDFIGMGLLCLSLCILVIGLKSDDFWPAIAVLLGGLGLVVFTRWEKVTRHPLVDVQLFRRRPFVIGGVIVGLQNLGMYALLFQLPFLLKAWYLLDPAKTGQILLIMMIFMVFLNTIFSGLCVSIAGLIMLLYTTGSPALLWMPVSLALVGSGIGMVTGPAQSAALSAVPAEQSGVAAGILSTMRYLGGIAGITIISTILISTDPAGILQQNKICFGIYIGVYVFALLLALAIPRHSRPLL
jgi:MFS family permease